jgi:hypothetical protein
MTITLEIGPELEAELARQAAARGIGIDAYAAGLLKEATRTPAADAPPPEEVIEAIDRLKTFGKTHSLSLGGTTIRDLRHEARP